MGRYVSMLVMMSVIRMNAMSSPGCHPIFVRFHRHLNRSSVHLKFIKLCYHWYALHLPRFHSHSKLFSHICLAACRMLSCDSFQLPSLASRYISFANFDQDLSSFSTTISLFDCIKPVNRKIVKAEKDFFFPPLEKKWAKEVLAVNVLIKFIPFLFQHFI